MILSVFAPCRPVVSTTEMANLFFSALFYHTRVWICKELTIWRMSQINLYFRKDKRLRWQAELQTPPKRQHLWRCRETDVSPEADQLLKWISRLRTASRVRMFEKHLQKHMYELYFRFNLWNLWSAINPFGSCLAVILGDKVPID